MVFWREKGGTMKKWLLFFALSFALMGAACANKGQTVFEDAGKKVDQGTQTTGNKVDRGLNMVDQGAQTTGEKIDHGLDKAGQGLQKTGNKIEQGLNKAGENIEKGFNQAGEKVKDATQ